LPGFSFRRPEIKAIGYIRVSTGRQAREGVSLDVQEERIRAWAKANGAEAIEIFTDEGKSGRRVSNRPGLAAALDALGPGDSLVAYSLSRLVRSTVHAGRMLDRLRKARVNLVLLTENIDTRGPMGEFVFTIIAALAQLESAIISERVADAFAKTRSRGQKGPGSPPFGYFVRRGKLRPKGKEHRALQDMVSRRRAGESLRAIARHLEAAGIRRKTGGKKWSPQAVKQAVDGEKRRNA
jgi:DNA invertase Pin-like site-specific DNA recombinase